MRQENSKPANGCGCLVLLMCIGVLTAIAVPSYLNMANKAKQSEGKQYVSSLNKGQQAKFAENNAFSNSIAALELRLKTETTNYKYSTLARKQAAFNYGVSKQKTEKSYVGAVFLVPAKEVDPNAAKDEMRTRSILCEADDRGTIEPGEPIYQNGKLICGQGTTEVTK
ncbi:type IV pilin-like G/H family protein [Microcoleus sp. bin38.metabat.b11b12b14.051]|uniref:type IV pilin-like G/H family protein n=1 Tax=Microcoleus sp. bin38.metabat.b11b12b14.051 TaxID=2742709 RepID=UPI0025EF6A88|nr:type IV pilin-like G/H family protein [Microcoleus sp. bin38.metabat.b11b12b14.051]